LPEPALKGGTAEAEKPGKAPRRAASEVLTAQDELDARLAKLREPMKWLRGWSSAHSSTRSYQRVAQCGDSQL
jgi:hypothetical protein